MVTFSRKQIENWNRDNKFCSATWQNNNEKLFTFNLALTLIAIWRLFMINIFSCNKTTGVLFLKNADKIFSVGYDHAKIRLWLILQTSWDWGLEIGLLKKQSLEFFYKKSFLKNSTKRTWKHMCQSLFFNKVAGWGLNSAKFLRTPFLQSTSRRLLLSLPVKTIITTYDFSTTLRPLAAIEARHLERDRS